MRPHEIGSPAEGLRGWASGRLILVLDEQRQSPSKLSSVKESAGRRAGMGPALLVLLLGQIGMCVKVQDVFLFI